MKHLISYAYIKTYDKHHDDLNKTTVLLDSGAFTAFKQKKEISLDAYCEFLKNPPFKIWRYFALDRIGDFDTTDRNLQIMLDRGLNPIPVFQRGQPIEKLLELQEKFDLVGIGGVAGTNDRDSYLKYLLEYPGVVPGGLHLLGVNNLDIMRTYRPYSFDSIFTTKSVKYGQIFYFDEKNNSFRFIGREIVKMPKLMKQLPEAIQFGLMDDRGWQGCAKGGDEYNHHYKASLFFSSVLSKKLEAIGVNLFLIIPAWTLPITTSMMKEGLV